MLTVVCEKRALTFIYNLAEIPVVVPMADSKLMWLIGALVVLVLAIQVVIPTAITSASSFNAQGTATGETWNGTASVVHTMSYGPIVSVDDFRLSTYTSTYNDTLLASNDSANETAVFTLSNLDDGTVSGSGVNITTIFEIGEGSNVTVYRNGVYMAAITSSSTHTFGPYTELTSPLTLMYIFNGDNVSNVTNTTITYPYFATNTNYTVDTALGAITPTVTGTFYTTYTYGTGITGATLAVVLVLPLLVAVVVLVLIMKTGGLI